MRAPAPAPAPPPRNMRPRSARVRTWAPATGSPRVSTTLPTMVPAALSTKSRVWAPPSAGMVTFVASLPASAWAKPGASTVTW